MSPARIVWNGNADLKRLLRPLDDLTTHPSNPRRGDTEAIAESLRRFGQQRSILATPDGVIVAGNHTYRAAALVAWSHIAVTVSDLSEEEAEAFLLADNRTSDLGTYDEALLAQHLERQRDRINALTGTGYNAEDLAALLSRIDRRATRNDPNRVPDPPHREAKSQPGQVYELGRHRLVCGSSRSADAWELLDTFDVCFTSPPYALGDSMALRGSQRATTYETYEDTSAEWPSLMREFTALAADATRLQIVNVQMLAGNKTALVEWLHAERDRLVDILIWNKIHSAPAAARRVVNSTMEFLVLLGPRGSSRAIPFATFHGTQSNVIELPGQRNNPAPELHAATMPLDLPMFVLGEIVPKSQTVIDPFGGTGTTMIACEMLGKSCALIELDPLYCDVIRQRYADYVEDESFAP